MDRKLLIGYVTSTDLSLVTEADLSALDVINLAFGHIEDGGVTFASPNLMGELKRIRKVNPSIRVILSVGGWGADGFSQAASSEGGRKKFAISAVRCLEEYRLDGLDLDWEYPCIDQAGIQALPEDKYNFTKLIHTCREELDELSGEKRLLTIAAGAGEYFVQSAELSEIVKDLDYIQLMTYDLRGGFRDVTGHHTNLFYDGEDSSDISADTAVRNFFAAGVPYEKMVIGAAYYSRMWKEVPNVKNGLHQKSPVSIGDYGPSYGSLVKDYINKNGFVRYFDEKARAPWLFNGDIFITYDDEISCKEKAKYVIEKGLFGLMFWEYRLDETYTLTGVLRKALDEKE